MVSSTDTLVTEASKRTQTTKAVMMTKKQSWNGTPSLLSGPSPLPIHGITEHRLKEQRVLLIMGNNIQSSLIGVHHSCIVSLGKKLCGNGCDFSLGRLELLESGEAMWPRGAHGQDCPISGSLCLYLCIVISHALNFQASSEDNKVLWLFLTCVGMHNPLFGMQLLLTWEPNGKVVTDPGGVSNRMMCTTAASNSKKTSEDKTPSMLTKA
ncbi:uncharacterized protein [Oryctolagus cuniculus]|uniref:uncharacterized protein n=1 Tax=Oryctolagus cuniculus TaxID=9986 RepID=UPI00387A1D68